MDTRKLIAGVLICLFMFAFGFLFSVVMRSPASNQILALIVITFLVGTGIGIQIGARDDT